MDETQIGILVTLAAAVIPALLTQLVVYASGAATIKRLESELRVLAQLDGELLKDSSNLACNLMLKNGVREDLRKVAYRGLPLYTHPYMQSALSAVVSAAVCAVMALSSVNGLLSVAVGVVTGMLSGWLFQSYNVRKFERIAQTEEYEKIYDEIAKKTAEKAE